MQSQFEIEKNRKAFTYTMLICSILLLLAFFIRWTIALPPVPIVQDLIEINLGNNEEGYGQEQPLIKGEMSSSQERTVEQQEKATPSHDEPSKDIDADENEDKDAAPVVKPKRPNPTATTIAKESNTKRAKNNTPAPVVMQTPKPQKPLFTYPAGGNGKGNNATEDNYKYGQGNNPNGHGDKGDPSGKPPGGKTGVGISNGLTGRRITHLPSFQDDFSENAKVYVDVNVDGSGNVTNVSIAKGTSTTNPTTRSIALQKAKQLKFNAGEEDNGTIIFNFKVQN